MIELAPPGVRPRVHRTLAEAHQAVLEQHYSHVPAHKLRMLFLPKNKEEMIAFLARYAPSTTSWDDDRMYALWKEVRGLHPETFLIAERRRLRRRGRKWKWRVNRHIRTVTARAYRMLRSPTPRDAEHWVKEFLWEFRIQKDGSLVLRPFANSFSEKLYWTELIIEPSMRRLMREELGWDGRREPVTGRRRKKVSVQHLQPPYLVDAASETTAYYKEGRLPVSDTSRHSSDKFPGLRTVNELTHLIFNFNLPGDGREDDPEYRKPWYHEARTSNIFVFGDTRAAPPITHLRCLGLTRQDLGLPA